MSKICIIGDILLDVSLKNKETALKMRLGGIVHSARALWAMNVEYCVAYFSPKYLVSHIESYLLKFGNPELIYLGEVISCPYVMLINEVKEIGNQGYEFLLRENIKIEYNYTELEKLSKFGEVLIISGNFDLLKISRFLKSTASVNIDLANNQSDLLLLETIDYKFEKIFISTSSQYFLNYYRENSVFSIEAFFNYFKKFTKKVILKENRGGSRAYDFFEEECIMVTSQTQPIDHSVGVGDVYNAVTVVQSSEQNFEKSLNYASWIAAEYAVTTFPDDFKLMVKRVLSIPADELIALKGIQLPWEIRNKINIYIAAPDFDFVDKTYIDLVYESLLYHNFSPRRPITENGQVKENDKPERMRDIYAKDMGLLNECQIMIAVLLYNDPGTLVEIGIAAERKVPVLLFDPHNIVKNCMLLHTPDLVSNNLDEIISAVFSFSAKLT